jgi:hypothetical protein
VPDYGELYPTSGPPYDGVMYPATATPVKPYSYWVYIEAMAWALCHYMFNDVSVSVDPVGFARPRGTRIELTKLSIDHTAVQEPPMLLSCSIDGKAYEFVITETEEDIEKDTLSIKAHTRTQ